MRPFTKDDVQHIITNWLESDCRTLTVEQRNMLSSAFNECPLALYLRLSYDTASSWASYHLGDEIRLEKTVRASINELFRRLEVMHGQVLTSRAFSYITAGKHLWSVISLPMINIAKYMYLRIQFTINSTFSMMFYMFEIFSHIFAFSIFVWHSLFYVFPFSHVPVVRLTIRL